MKSNIHYLKQFFYVCLFGCVFLFCYFLEMQILCLDLVDNDADYIADNTKENVYNYKL